MTKFTLKSIITDFLQNASDSYAREAQLFSPLPQPRDGRVKLETNSLSRTKDNTKIIYKSAIAIKLANLWQLAPMQVARELALSCLYQGEANYRNHTPDLEKLSAYLEVQVIPPGLLLFELTDRGIAAWLQYFIAQIFLSAVDKDLLCLVPELMFKIQYSHARCCSLLQMASSDRLLALETPNSISWEEVEGRLRFNHSAERHLISEFFSTWDCLYFLTTTSQEINWEKIATSLSEAFQNFYSQCRIFGEVKIENPELAKARLGLVLITKYLLRSLLEEKLQIKAPIEL